jgi:FkbM family methyltransferase
MGRTLYFKVPGSDRIQPFTFRGRMDLGVLSHFYKEGYYIKDTPEHPIRTILDCGANIGDETVRFRLHYPTAEIIAVEADPDNATLLKKSFADDAGATVVDGAVWYEHAELTLCKQEGHPEASSVSAEAANGRKIRAFSIPELMKMRGWQNVDILKLDIEGAEYDLFSRNVDWLSTVNAIIFEVADLERCGTLQMIMERLRGTEWVGFACGENLVLVRQSLQWKAMRVLGVNGA